MIYARPEEILFKAAMANPAAYWMAVWSAWASNPAKFYLDYWKAWGEALKSYEKSLDKQT